MATPAQPPRTPPQPPQPPVPAGTTQLGTVTPINANSAWATQQGNTYDPMSYYVAAKSGSGKYEHLRIRMLPWQHRVLQGLKDDPNHPSYKSVDDVIRDAITHLLALRDTQSRNGMTNQAMKDALDRFLQEQDQIDMDIKLTHCETMLTTIRKNWDRAVEWEMWERLHASIASQRDHGETWEGELRTVLMRMCDEYERKIPQGILF